MGLKTNGILHSWSNCVVRMFTICWVLNLLVLVHLSAQDELQKEYLENLILRKVDEAISYDFPRDNSEYFNGIVDDQIHDYGTFDFVVIGSGSTGSVLANRLSSVRSWKILLIEAGGQDDTFSNIPSMYSFLLRSDKNWGYNTTSQKYGCKGMLENRCSYPRGKVLGGSSSINGLVYTRGNPKDYDRWEEAGNYGWSYQNVEKYFKKLENAQFCAHNLGHSGPMYLNYSSPFVPLQEAFFEGFELEGIQKTNYNSKNQVGTSRIQSNIKNGRRVSGSNAYIRPALHRKNLNITLGAFVTKILIDSSNKRAYGVRFVRNNKVFDVLVNKEVILSAGAINSPQTLMLSGIGPEYLLNKHNIPIVEDLPVGETLIDQIAYNLQFSSNYTQDPESLGDQISSYLKGTGLLTAPFNGKSLSFIDMKKTGRPDVEFVLLPPTGGSDFLRRSPASPYIPSIDKDYNTKINATNFFSITIILLHPKSTGTVMIQSSDPKDFPLIDSAIFSKQEDKKALYDAIQFAINITKTDPFQRINATVFSPIPPCFEHELYSKDYWYCAMSYMALPTYHSMGTTSMGPDPITSVVNSKLQVHGIENLRVADCGIIPQTISGHTSGPAFMIGEKLSSIIIEDYRDKINR